MQDSNNKINDGGATSAGLLAASEWNQPMSEIQKIITSVGQTLSGGDLEQAAKGIADYATVGDFFIGTGGANSYTASVSGSRLAPPALVDGMKIRMEISTTNTGASTLNAFGTGSVNIKKVGGTANPASGQLVAGTEYTFTYRTSPSAHWEIDAGDFDKSADGYLTLPASLGGFLVQWGGESVVDKDLVTFPTPFPNACLWAMASEATNSTSGIGEVVAVGVAHNNWTTTQLMIRAEASTFCTWLAIGY